MTEYALAPSRKFTATSAQTPSAMLEQGVLNAYRVRSNGSMRHLELYPLASTAREAAEWINDRVEMDGASVQAVARELHVSTPTVRRYLEGLALTEEIESGEWDDLRFDSAGDPAWLSPTENEEEAISDQPICTCAAEALGNNWHTPGCPLAPAQAEEATPRASVRKCTVCSKVVTDRNSAGKQYRALGFKDMCVACYDASGLENEHSDGHHVDDPNPECPQCKDPQPVVKPRTRRPARPVADVVKAAGLPWPTDEERAAALADVPGSQCEPMGTPADEVEAALAASVAQAQGAALAVCFCNNLPAHAPGAQGCKNVAAPVRRVRSH
jgi:hypothetical protein